MEEAGWEVLQPGGLGDLHPLHLGCPGVKLKVRGTLVPLRPALEGFRWCSKAQAGYWAVLELKGLHRGAQAVEEPLEFFGGHVPAGAGDLAPVLVMQQGGGEGPGATVAAGWLAGIGRLQVV